MPSVSHHGMHLVLIDSCRHPREMTNGDKSPLFLFSVDEILKNHCQTCHSIFQQVFSKLMYAENCQSDSTH